MELKFGFEPGVTYNIAGKTFSLLAHVNPMKIKTQAQKAQSRVLSILDLRSWLVENRPGDPIFPITNKIVSKGRRRRR